jgi:hypothetical protein
MGKRSRWARATALACAALASVTAAACSGPGPGGGGSTLNRPADPVVLTGAQAPGLQGIAPGRLVAFRASGGRWAQLPVQVDERRATTMAAVYNLPASTTFYGASIDVPVTTYADPTTFVGADPNAAVDADDEVVFMSRDAGGPRGSLPAPAGTRGGAVEVRVNDPLDTAAAGYVYLFDSDGSLDPSAGQSYVDYDFSLNSGDYRATYRRTDGPNPEDSSVTGRTYRAHFSDRWLLDRITLAEGDRPTADVIDRIKWDIPLFCVRNENTFNEEEGAFVVNKSGPVRALRSYVGANSGPNTQNTHAFYDTSVDTTVDLRVHAIPVVGAHVDYSRQAFGMTFRDPTVPNGVPVDGSPEAPPATTPSWWTLHGAQGGLGYSAIYDTDASGAPVRWYEDDTTPAQAQCTGDGEAIGDSGAHFNNIACTDPGLDCTQHFQARIRIVATSAATTPAELQRQASQRLRPLTITATGG